MRLDGNVSPHSHSQPPYLAYRFWDPEPTAVVGQAHSDLQAYSMAHRDIEGFGAAVMALQGLWMEAVKHGWGMFLWRRAEALQMSWVAGRSS